MVRTIKRKIRSLLGIKNTTDYYSQGGEDAIITKTFYTLIPKKGGFYIDIGAYHPFKHSNTYILYKAGWRGINIDPRPGSKALFDRFRPNDTNVEAGIGGQNGKMTYYMLGEDSTMNTFSKENLVRMGLFEQVKRTVDIPVYTMDTLVKDHPGITEIDYLNIDAEGFEMEILSGHNFGAYPPKVISIEQNNVFTLADVADTEVCKFLATKKYTPYAKNFILPDVATIFYVRNEFLPKQ